MSAPLPVAIVRRRFTTAQAVGYLIGGVAGTFLIAWLLMLIAGAVTDWGASYWDALLSLIAIRLMQVGSGWRYWTHEAKS